MNKKNILILFIFVLAANLKAQISNDFAKEVTAVLDAKTSSIVGKEIEKQASATIYDTKLKISGFDLTYAETIFGDDLSGIYIGTSSDSVIDAISQQLKNIPYQILDSKQTPEIISKSIFDSDILRKIIIKDKKTQEKVMTITRFKDYILMEVFV
ncbi:hypothetical protein [Chryseobacterium culicis]|uniref:hypothetical protein n=1 Tax=Chryseobacterium culicis TaxID=680127 RepID=UPI0018756E4E|nr:hypothetical protein [Chryseobacterium culicis]MBE4948248.1 hypothetical protein [Chryseobacterium culicis]